MELTLFSDLLPCTDFRLAPELKHHKWRWPVGKYTVGPDFALISTTHRVISAPLLSRENHTVDSLLSD